MPAYLAASLHKAGVPVMEPHVCLVTGYSTRLMGRETSINPRKGGEN